MASLYRNQQTGKFEMYFRYGGKQFHKSLKTKDRTKAESIRAHVEETIHDLERGKVELPPDADLWEFLKTGGKRAHKLEAHSVVTLADLFVWYFGSQPEGGKGQKSLSTTHVHERHFLRILGKKRNVATMTGADVQDYINKRAGESKHGRRIKRETIGKEVGTLRSVWSRAFKQGKVSVLPPNADGLQYPRGKERPSFQTWEEIEHAIAEGNLSQEEQRERWDCLYLSWEQVRELLAFAKDRETRSEYIYPLLVFAACTGARLSEIMRSLVEDFKFESKEVWIREKKRRQEVSTFRRVRMHDLLYRTMKGWFAKGHPGGSYTICRKADNPMNESTLHEAFEWFFRDSKWSVLRGYHVFRHSLASILASQGKTQQDIDETLGHQTEEMRKRYRHFFPEQRKNVLSGLR
jgi:integrase